MESSSSENILERLSVRIAVYGSSRETNDMVLENLQVISLSPWTLDTILRELAYYMAIPMEH